VRNAILTSIIVNVYHQKNSQKTYATHVIYDTTNVHAHLRQKQLIKMMTSNNQMIRKIEMLNLAIIFKTFYHQNVLNTQILVIAHLTNQMNMDTEANTNLTQNFNQQKAA
jgi:hypothetical protein